jgi:hypothetical protein
MRFLLFFALSVSPAFALPDAPKPKPVADEKFWTVVGVLGASAAADYVTTMRLQDRGGIELNPFLGRHPSRLRVAAMGGGYFAGEVLMAYELKKFSVKHKWARFLWIGEPAGQTEEHIRLAWHNEGVRRFR